MNSNFLPPEYQFRLLGLEKELRDGDITEKGFEKKRNALFEEYRSQYPTSFSSSSNSNGVDGLRINEITINSPPPIDNNGDQYNTNTYYSPQDYHNLNYRNVQQYDVGKNPNTYQNIQPNNFLDQPRFVTSGGIRNPSPIPQLTYSGPQHPKVLSPPHSTSLPPPHQHLPPINRNVSPDLDIIKNRTQSGDQLHSRGPDSQFSGNGPFTTSPSTSPSNHNKLPPLPINNRSQVISSSNNYGSSHYRPMLPVAPVSSQNHLLPSQHNVQHSTSHKFYPQGQQQQFGGAPMNVGGVPMNMGVAPMNMSGAPMNVGGVSMNMGGASMNMGGVSMNMGGAPMNVTRPIQQPQYHVMGPAIPQTSLGVGAGNLSTPGGINRTHKIIMEDRNIGGGNEINPRPSLDVSDTASIKGYSRNNLDYDYDDNVSIRSARSNIIGFSNSDTPAYEGFTQLEDDPGRNVGNRMSMYNPRFISDPLGDSASFDKSLSKLAGQQFMPFEPREIPFDCLDPLDPTKSLGSFPDIASILRYRGQATPKQQAFLVLDQKGREIGDWTWEKLYLRAGKMGQIILREGKLAKGDRVALIYRKNEILEFLVSLYGCFFAGVVAVPINAVEEFSELLFILESSDTKLALTTDHNLKAFTRDLAQQKKELPANVQWWKTNDFGSLNLKKDELDHIDCTELAYMEYTKSPNGELKGVAISHRTIIAQCNVMRASVVDDNQVQQMLKYSKIFSENPINQAHKGGEKTNIRYSDILLTYLEPRQQVGLILGALWGVYCGNITIFLNSLGPDTPGLWVNSIHKYQVTIALADYPGLKPIVKSFRTDPSATLQYHKKVIPSLSSLRFLFVDTMSIDISVNQEIIENLLTPLNCLYPKDVLTALISLSEHGGMILSFGDLIGVKGLDEMKEGERGIKEFLLYREELKENKIVIFPDDRKDEISDKEVIKVGAFGFVMPEATIAVVDPETTALCLPNNVGEIWVDSPSLSGGFWNLPKHTEFIFHAKPIFVPGDTMQPGYFDQEFLRTGLLGSLVNGQLIVFGLYEHRIKQLVEENPDAPKKLVVVNPDNEVKADEEEEPPEKYKYHYTLDLENTIRKRIEKVSECVVIEIYINDQNLPVLIAEADSQPELLPSLGNEIYNILFEYHGLKLYCVSICLPSSLPRIWKNGKKLLNPVSCKKAFEWGKLKVLYVKTWVDTVVNIPAGVDASGIWGTYARSERDGLINGVGISRRPQIMAVGSPSEVLDERTGINMLEFRSIVDVLLWRSEITPEEDAYKLLDVRGKDSKALSWKKLNNRIASIANFLQKKGCKAGDHVILMFPQGLDFVCTVYACMVLGIISIPLDKLEPSRVSEDIPALFGLIEDFKISFIILNNEIEALFKNKTIQNFIKTITSSSQPKFPGNQNGGITKLSPFINVSKTPKFNKLLKESNYVMKEEWLNPNWTAIVMCYFSADQRRNCVKLGHDTLLALCKVQKETCRLTSNRAVVSCVRGFSGIGFVHTCLIGIYLGSPTMLLTPFDYSTNPLIWFETMSKYKIKDSYATFLMLQHAITTFENVDYRTFSLQHLKNLMIPIENRPNANFYKKIIKTFLANRLDDVALNYVYSHVANPMVTARSYMCVEPIELYLDLKSLRRGIVKIVDPEEEPFGILIHDSGMVPVSTKIVIVHPETRRPCLTNEFGEIWISSDANAKSSYGSNDPLDRERFCAHIDGNASMGIGPRTPFLRSGDLGFIHTVHKPVGDNGALVEFQCLFFLGPIAETFEVNGLMHFPMDIEFTVERCHHMSLPGLITFDGCVTFQTNGETVCVVEVRSADGILNLVPCILNAILDEHQFIIDVIVFVKSGSLQRSRLGEKQRAKVMTNWLNGNLDTIHVHYVKPPPTESSSQALPTYQQPSVILQQQYLVATNPSPVSSQSNISNIASQGNTSRPNLFNSNNSETNFANGQNLRWSSSQESMGEAGDHSGR